MRFQHRRHADTAGKWRSWRQRRIGKIAAPHAPNNAVRRARTDDIPALNSIERATDAAHYTGILKNADNLPTDKPEHLHTAAQTDFLWVAVDDADRPVGYCYLRLISAVPHIEEVSVHPDHGRRGLGRQLVAAVRTHVRDAGYGQITLTTFRELPWNGPFYTSLGFVEVPREEVSREYLELLAEEDRELVPDPIYTAPLTRVLMRCDLTRGT